MFNFSKFYLHLKFQFTIDSYHESDDPYVKMMAAFDNHESFTASIREEVIDYTHANWAGWERDPPDWFPGLLAQISDDFIPGRNVDVLDALAVMGGKKGRERKKPVSISSMKEVVIMLTTVDTMTDIFMIYLYNENGLHRDANTLITLISINTIFQLLGVLVQYNKKGWRTLLREGLITVLFLRPFVDAWRVHNKHDDSDTTLKSIQEVMMNKGIELATESIPGCVLQCYVLLLNPSLGSSNGAIISIGLSAFMTGLTSAMIAYDFDIDPFHRKTQPMFYGYIKDGRRGWTFFLMTMISTLHNLSRSLGYAILAVVDLNLALKFFVGEVGVYLLFKLFKRDFYYWLRLEGVLSVIIALLFRTLVKVVADFTVSGDVRSARSEWH